jgi:hypothetical protein
MTLPRSSRPALLSSRRAARAPQTDGLTMIGLHPTHSTLDPEGHPMPRITVKAVHADGEPRRWTLSERIVTDNLASDHYATQLIERLRWATAEAEALEVQPTPDSDLSAPHRAARTRRTRPREQRARAA